MGITNGSAQFLIECCRKNGHLKKVITFGKLGFRVGRYGRLFGLLNRANLLEGANCSTVEELKNLLPRGATDKFLKILGASSIDSLDISSYQGASIIHDLNNPLDEKHHCTYDTVLDGGTLEHVFNFPEGLTSAMNLVKPGGDLIFLTMANNYCGHGFYQFGPELFYRALSLENGFEMKLCQFYANSGLINAEDPGPKRISGQVPANDTPLMLMVCAKKIFHKKPFQVSYPVQGQYAPQWQAGENSQ
jgi:hypothetical protein